jgi:hypothetical protein
MIAADLSNSVEEGETSGHACPEVVRPLRGFRSDAEDVAQVFDCPVTLH